ncbi:MAG: flagellar biosynthesis protein FlhF [Zoogloea sp.]|nr:flagellar biosynthesis protein FlhF [Zoogloea sp.]
MNVKRYFAQTAREALRRLKDDMGADAIVLANRAVEGGVEILALPADAVAALNSPTRQQAPVAPAVRRPQEPPPARQMRSEADFRTSPLQSAAPRPASAMAPPRQEAPTRPFQPPRVDPQQAGRSAQGDAPQQARQEAAPGRAAPPARSIEQVSSAAARKPSAEEEARLRALEATNTHLVSELSAIRGMIQQQLAGFAWGEMSRGEPVKTQVMADLLEAGFSAQLARELTEAASGSNPQEARMQVKHALNGSLRALATDADIIDRGGVYALVGPTGVGKTTTTAKLAARCVVRHGADKLALITTDGYRIGAHEQLRIYGRILGVPVFVVRDAADLRQTLAELRSKHMVLIDTVGMSQRDQMVAEQAAMLTGAGRVRRLLLLNATARGDTLDDVVRAYSGPDLAGCVLTKVDETVSLGPALDVAVRHDIELFYVANGQRVPEDLHLPNRAYLLHRALKELPPGSPFQLDSSEAGLLMGASAAAAARAGN